MDKKASDTEPTPERGQPPVGEIGSEISRQRPELERSESEKIIEARLEEMLINEAKVNEGNNGIILRVASEHFPEDFLRAVKTHEGVEIKQDGAVKILKVYGESQVDRDKSSAQHEFDMQRKAYDVLTQSTKYGEISAVPKPILFKDIELAEATKHALKSKGLDRVGDRVEIILMDFVEGEDLAHLLYRKVATDHPKAEAYKQSSVNLDDFNDAQSVAALILDFEKPGGKHSTEAARQFEQRQVERRNYDKIYGYLQKNNMLLNPRIRKQIGKSMRIFHENGLAFRDGHERNFIIDGDPKAIFDATGKLPVQTYIIDYGSSMDFGKSQYGDHLYRKEILGEKKDYPADEIISRSLELVSPPEERKANIDLSSQLGSHKETFFDELKKIPKGKSPLEYAWETRKALPEEEQIVGFAAGIDKFIQQKRITRKDAEEYIQSILSTELEDNPWQANQLREAFTHVKK